MNYCYYFYILNMRYNDSFIFIFIKVSCGFTQIFLFNSLVSLCVPMYYENFLHMKALTVT
jgi:hypothetical protein